jgi:polyprenyl-phospho-N-acetylgalactosaminyl synthase
VPASRSGVTTTAAVLVPAFNAPPWSNDFVARMRAAFQALRETEGVEPCLVLVDDGSRAPGTQEGHHRPVLGRVGGRVLTTRHAINQGQGAALQTALEIARGPLVAAEWFVTFDADGQHAPEDIPPLLAHVRTSGLDIVFGNRFAPEYLAENGIPASRRVLLRLASIFDRWFTGLSLHDVHNGLRAFGRKAAAVIELRQNRMAHATEFKMVVARHRLRYGEFPMRMRYTDETLRQGQDNLNAVNILGELFASWWFQ